MAYTLTVSLALGAGKTGLTLTPALKNPDGTAALGLTTTNLIEVAAGSGAYAWTGTLPNGFRGYLQFSNGGTFLSHVAINPQEVENADVKTSSISGGSGASAADVWSYASRTLTQTAAQVIAALQGSTVTILRGDTLTIPFTGLGALVGRSKLWFTFKTDLAQTDQAAVIQVEESAGLLYLNGLPATSGQGSIVVTDATTGALTVTLTPPAAALLAPVSGFYDVQQLVGTAVHTVTSGLLAVTGDVTRATS
jgi:hypothetical protein